MAQRQSAQGKQGQEGCPEAAAKLSLKERHLEAASRVTLGQGRGSRRRRGSLPLGCGPQTTEAVSKLEIGLGLLALSCQVVLPAP